MSRNLCSTNCRWCGGEVVLSEEPRKITVADCGRHFDEYRGMFVANAHCYDCEAQYLAWVDGSNTRHGYPAPARLGESRVRDLSFRSSFDDEPNREDFPKFAIKRGIVAKVPWSDEVAEHEAYAGYWRRR